MPKAPADDAPEEILATLRATPLRRWTGVILLGVFTVILIQVGVELPADRALMRVAAFALALLSIVQALMLWRATGRAIELTPDLLRESGPGGRILARLSEIERVDTGAFSYRPASGFLILCHAPGGFAFAPGMWWRQGRRIGIGGVTAKAHGRIFANVLNQRLAALRAERA